MNGLWSAIWPPLGTLGLVAAPFVAAWLWSRRHRPESSAWACGCPECVAEERSHVRRVKRIYDYARDAQ
jgi:hypothetical protein